MIKLLSFNPELRLFFISATKNISVKIRTPVWHRQTANIRLIPGPRLCILLAEYMLRACFPRIINCWGSWVFAGACSVFLANKWKKQSLQDRVSYWVVNLATDSCHFGQQNKKAAGLGWKNPAWCLLPFKVKDQCVKFELQILGSNLPLDLQWRLWQAQQQQLGVGVAKEIVNRWQRRAEHNSDHVIKNTMTKIATNCFCHHQNHKKASRAFSLMSPFHLFTHADLHSHKRRPVLPYPSIPPPVRRAISPSISVCEGLCWCVSNDNVPAFLSVN